MGFLRYTFITCLFIVTLCGAVSAANALDYVDNLEVRPDVGYGYAVAKDHKEGMGYHAGVRILSDVRSLSTPTPQKRYGISITEVSPFESKAELRHLKYLAFGIMLEQTMPKDLVITIGTLGYIGMDQAKNNPWGLNAELGWEPILGKAMQGFVALRAETIYDTSTIIRYSASAGIKFAIF